MATQTIMHEGQFPPVYGSLSEQPGGPLLALRAGPGYAALGGDWLLRPPGPLVVRMSCLNGSRGELRLLD